MIREDIKHLKCPVCKTNSIEIHAFEEGRYRVQCKNHVFDCHVKTFYFPTKEKAIEEFKKIGDN